MSYVRGLLRHPSTAEPLKNKSVTVQLASAGFVPGEHSEIVQSSFCRTSSGLNGELAAGTFQIDLTPNADIDPAGTSYKLTIPGNSTPWTIVVPAGTAPNVDGSTHFWWFEDILVDSPPSPASVVTGVVDIVAGTGVTVDATDPQRPVVSSEAGGAVSSVFTRTGDVVAASGDYAAYYDALGAAATAQAAAIAAAATDATTKANAAAAASQPLDPDLTTIAALDASTAGVLATDGAGWIRKTYAQLKTALGLVKADVGLGNVDNTSDVNKPVSTAQQTALDLKAPLASPTFTGHVTVPTPTNTGDAATKAYVDGLVTGLYDLRGTYDASGNTFPTTGGSGAAGAVVKGDTWVISVAGTLGTKAVVAGDVVTAVIDTPGQTAGNWSIIEHDLGYTPLNAASNLSDLTNAATARGNLGLGTAATQNKVAAGSAGVLDATDGSTTNSRAPNGAAGGDLAGTYPNPTLKNTGTAGTYGDATHTVTVTTDGQGRVTAVTTNLITGSSFTRQLKTANYTAAIGDYVAADTTGGGPFTITLPAASGGKGTIVLKWVAGTLAPSIALTGSDHFDTSTGSTGGAFTLLNQAATYDSDGTSIYSVRNSFALSTLDSRYPRSHSIGSGQYLAPVPYSAASASAFGTGIGIAYPLDLPPVTVAAIGINVNGAAAGAKVRLGIYSDVGGLPANLLLDAGQVDASTTGHREATVASFVLPAGRYWLNSTVQVAAVNLITLANCYTCAPINSNSAAWGDGISGARGGYFSSTSGVTGGLPSTFGICNGQSQGSIPHVFLVAA